jgi:hypothetical protein
VVGGGETSLACADDDDVEGVVSGMHGELLWSLFREPPR